MNTRTEIGFGIEKMVLSGLVHRYLCYDRYSGMVVRIWPCGRIKLCIPR